MQPSYGAMGGLWVDFCSYAFATSFGGKGRVCDQNVPTRGPRFRALVAGQRDGLKGYSGYALLKLRPPRPRSQIHGGHIADP